MESITLFSELFKNISETPFEQKELTAPQDGFLAEPKTEEQLTFLTSLAYVEEMATGVQGQRRKKQKLASAVCPPCVLKRSDV